MRWLFFLLLLTSPLGAVPVLTLDRAARQAPVIVNGRVIEQTPGGEATIERLALLKGESPERFTLRLPSDPAPTLTKGHRYTFLIRPDDRGGFETVIPSGSFCIIPLIEGQPDDAPLISLYTIATRARSHFAKLRPEADYAESPVSTVGESGEIWWRVRFPRHRSQFNSPVDESGELTFSRDGRVTGGWIAAETPRAAPESSDIGEPLRFTLKGDGDPSAYPHRLRAYYGTLRAIDAGKVTGDFFSLSGEPPLTELPLDQLRSVQRLALVPATPKP